jgi:hypothetical protein
VRATTKVYVPPPPDNLTNFSTLGSLQVFRLVQPGPLRWQVGHPGPQQAPLGRHMIQRRKDVGWPEQDRDDPVCFRSGDSCAGIGIGINVRPVRVLAVRRLLHQREESSTGKHKHINKNNQNNAPLLKTIPASRTRSSPGRPPSHRCPPNPRTKVSHKPPYNLSSLLARLQKKRPPPRAPALYIIFQDLPMNWSWPAPARFPPSANGNPRWRNHRRRAHPQAAIINWFQVVTITLVHTKRTLIHTNKTLQNRLP